MHDVHGVVQRMIERGKAGEGTIRKPGPTSIQLQIENMWLNIWEPADGEVLTCMPHTHQRGFTSTVLLGRLITERLKTIQSPRGDYDLYTITKKDDGRVMEYTPMNIRCDIDRRDITVQPMGTIYHCPREIFHVVHQPELTMTFLQLWGEPECTQFGLLPRGCETRLVQRYQAPDTLEEMWKKVDEVCAKANITL